MLEAVNNASELSELAPSPYTARLCALFDTYGCKYDFAKFWRQSPSAALCAVDSNVTLQAGGDADFDEIKIFLGFYGFSTLTCSADCAARLGFTADDSSYTVEFTDPEKAVPAIDGCAPVTEYRELYRLLTDCGFELGDYHSFLADIAARARTGAAESLGFFEDGRLLACASALFVSGSCVLLGAVGTLPEARGRGLASALVSGLALKYKKEGKRVFLLCRNDSLAAFYGGFGFKVVDRWAVIKK